MIEWIAGFLIGKYIFGGGNDCSEELPYYVRRHLAQPQETGLANLEPCWKCGGQAGNCIHHSESRWEDWVMCCTCRENGPMVYGNGINDAGRRWNKRAKQK